MAQAETETPVGGWRPGTLSGRVIALAVASIALLAINQIVDSLLSLAFEDYKSPLPALIGLVLFLMVAVGYIFFLRQFPNITHKIAYLIVIALFFPVIFISVGFMAVLTTDLTSFMFYNITCGDDQEICGSAFAFAAFTEAIRLLPSVVLVPLVYLYSLRFMKVTTFLHKPEGTPEPKVNHHLYRTDLPGHLLMDAPQDTLNAGIAYASLAALTAALLAMEDLSMRVSYFYGLAAIIVTLLVTIGGQSVLRGKTRPRYRMLTYQIMMIVFDCILAVAPLMVLVAKAIGGQTPDTSSAAAIVAFIAFVSLPISNRLLAPMLAGKAIIFFVCAVFVIIQSDFAYGSSTLVIMQLMALLLISALGYYFHIRVTGELSLRVALAELQKKTSEQNRQLEQAVKTEQRTARRLESEMELRQRLMRFVGHDFRQPINAISLMVFRMKRDRISEQTARILEKCEACVKSANGMIESLLDLSLLDHKQRQAELRAVNASEILAGVRSEFEIDAERRKVPLVIMNSSLNVRVDSNILLRILRNYVTNAMRYAPDGRILVGVRRRGQLAEFQVVDEGPGITDDLKEKIFEEFFQVDVTMPAAGDGLGLGLAITRELARSIDGKVTFDSQAGKGSNFGICVPVCEDAHPPRQAPVMPPRTRQPAVTPVGANAGQVLIIDDDVKFAGALADALRSLDQTVTVYNGPFEDRETISKLISSAGLVLLDYNLGNGQTGPALAASLGLAPTGPAYVVTAEPDPALLQRLRDEGWRILKKPVSGETLAKIIQPTKEKA